MKLLRIALLALLLPAPALGQAAPEEEPAGHEHAAHDHAAHAERVGDEASLALRRSEPWPERALELAASLPIQDGGRIKPLSTYADFALLRFSGKRTLKVGEGEQSRRLSSVEWLLDTLFFPTLAAEYPLFLVENRAVLEALGVDHAGKKERDRYSWLELEPGLQKLYELAGEYHAIDEKQRSSLQQQLVVLWRNVYDYGSILSRPEALALVPPRDGSETWTSVVEDQDSLRAFAEMVYAREDLPAFTERLASFHGAAVSRAEARGEYDKIPLELSYYRLEPVPRSLYVFVLAFLCSCALWLRPRSKLLQSATIGVVSGVTAVFVVCI
jgi:hypothetical protein